MVPSPALAAIKREDPFELVVNGHRFLCRPNVEASIDFAAIIYSTGEVVWTAGVDDDDLKGTFLDLFRYATATPAAAARKTFARGVA